MTRGRVLFEEGYGRNLVVETMRETNVTSLSGDKKTVLLGLAKQVVKRRGIASRVVGLQADIDKAKAEEASINASLSTALGDDGMALAAVEVIADTLPQEQDGASGGRVSKAALLRREKRGEAYARINALSRLMVPGREGRVGYLEALTDFISPDGLKARRSGDAEGVIQERAWFALNGLLHVVVTRCYDCMAEDGVVLFDDGLGDLFPKEWSKEITLGALADWFVAKVDGLDKGEGIRAEGGLVAWLSSLSEAVSPSDGDDLNGSEVGYEAFSDFAEMNVDDTIAVMAAVSETLAVFSDSDAPKSTSGGDGSTRRRGRKSKAEKDAEAAAAAGAGAEESGGESSSEAAVSEGSASEGSASEGSEPVVNHMAGDLVSGGDATEA